MATLQDISNHYTQGNLLGAIQRGLESLGRTTDTVTIDDLAPVDEFHIGGRQASEHFLSQLGFSAEMHILDVGCGLGGAARFVASRYKSRVTGIDLTPEYIETAKVLCRWVGLQDRIFLQEGSALALPFPDSAFDGGYMLHVGMNIADKTKLCLEVGRVLRTGSHFGIYDVMRTGDGELTYPVPWATTVDTSAVAKPIHYRKALQEAGFVVIAESDRRDFALAFFDQLRAKTSAAGGPPPLGLHVLMGNSTSDKVKNMIDNISAGRIAPVELVAQKTRR
jgi:ubiquinone/menaquinone biosynthesis C-methylase UbiE